jgi:hypothetical protein
MPQKIVRPLDTPRLMAAERGVSAAMGNVLNRVGETWNTRVLARLYALGRVRNAVLWTGAPDQD